jgi:PIN domain nuclease of toxin-antitoxin system
MARLLLDTHVFLWVLEDDPQLPEHVRKEITMADEVFVSSIAIYEIAVKSKQTNADGSKKIDANPNEVAEQIEQVGFSELPVTARHVLFVQTLPPAEEIHKDPWDRIMIAQAKADDLVLVTHDEKIAKYPVVRLLKF